MKKYILLSCIMVLIISSCNTQPESLEYFKEWVSLKASSDESRIKLAEGYIKDRFQVSLNLSLAGDYINDGSGDASWAESKVYYFLAEDYLINGIESYESSISILENIEAYYESIFLTYGEDEYAEVGAVLYGGYEEFLLACLISDVQDLLVNADYHEDSAEYYAELSVNNDSLFENIAKICATIHKDLLPKYAEMAIVEDWWKIEEQSSGKLDSYQAVYYLNNEIYVLCSVLEKDNGGSEIKILNSSEHLLDLY